MLFVAAMDTTLDPAPVWAGKALFYKLQAEAFLQSAGVGFSIIKPCGLADDLPGGTQKLMVGHDDTLMGGNAISRADVASVVVAAVNQRTSGLRFDICGGSGTPTTDFPALLKSARWPWQRMYYANTFHP
jgi:hypothetical protein